MRKLYPSKFTFLCVSTLTLGAGVGCLTDDIRKSDVSGRLCSALETGLVFAGVALPWLVIRRREPLFADLAFAAGGGVIGTVMASMWSPTGLSHPVLVGCAVGVVIGQAFKHAIDDHLAGLGQIKPRWRLLADWFSFLLLAILSGLGGGFCLMFASARANPETACGFGAMGAAVGAVIAPLVGVLLYVAILPRPLQLMSVSKVGSIALLVGCLTAPWIGIAVLLLVPTVALVAAFHERAQASVEP